MTLYFTCINGHLLFVIIYFCRKKIKKLRWCLTNSWLGVPVSSLSLPEGEAMFYSPLGVQVVVTYLSSFSSLEDVWVLITFRRNVIVCGVQHCHLPLLLWGCLGLWSANDMHSHVQCVWGGNSALTYLSSSDGVDLGCADLLTIYIATLIVCHLQKHTFPSVEAYRVRVKKWIIIASYLHDTPLHW